MYWDWQILAVSLIQFPQVLMGVFNMGPYIKYDRIFWNFLTPSTLEMFCDRCGFPRTHLRITDTNLNCVFVENTFVFIILNWILEEHAQKVLCIYLSFLASSSNVGTGDRQTMSSNSRGGGGPSTSSQGPAPHPAWLYRHNYGGSPAVSPAGRDSRLGQADGAKSRQQKTGVARSLSMLLRSGKLRS